MSLEYLKGLNDRYEKWIAEYKGEVIVLDADHLDFVERPEDFFAITNQIDSQLFGLFGSLSAEERQKVIEPVGK